MDETTAGRDSKTASGGIETLLDRQEISDCLGRYARGVDRLDRELVLSAFHPDAVIDQGMFVGAPVRFVEWAFAMHTTIHTAHQHFLMNQVCTIDGDTARTETYFQFVGVNASGEPPLCSSGGRYIDAFERREGQWRIALRVALRDWTSSSTGPGPGNGRIDDASRHTAVAAFLDDRARALLAGGRHGRRDRSDPSYDDAVAIGVARLDLGDF